MANVQLIDFTGKGRNDQSRYAADLLVFTKSTRLEMDNELLGNIHAMAFSKIEEELNYMANTIPSSWEFVDVTFLISGVSRAAAQQITRTRTASYAMQSQRVTNASEMEVINPIFSDRPQSRNTFNQAAAEAKRHYRTLVQNGVKAEDARGILPMNTTCNIVAKYNLRSFVDLIKARSSLRVQGEYSQIADDMKAEVLKVWPWAAPFFKHPADKAIAILEKVVKDHGLQTGHGAGWEISKAIDLVRKS